MRWVIRDCDAPAAATIEMHLEKATIAFQWQFEPLGDGRTPLTQRIVLRGENAAAYLEQVESVFKSALAQWDEKDRQLDEGKICPSK